MSRIGEKKLVVPTNVNVEITNDKVIVKGPKGELTRQIPKDVIVKNEEGHLTVELKNKSKRMLLLYKEQ